MSMRGLLDGDSKFQFVDISLLIARGGGGFCVYGF